MLYQDRAEAGRRLAERLSDYKGRHVVVLALPGAAVVTASEVARALGAPVVLLAVRPITLPTDPGTMIGAVAADGFRVLERALIDRLGIDERTIAMAAAEELRRMDQQRGHLPLERLPDLKGRIALVVDDGSAASQALRAGVLALRAKVPARVVVAAPVLRPDVFTDVQLEAEDLVTLATARPHERPEDWYGDHRPIPDEEVQRLVTQPGQPGL